MCISFLFTISVDSILRKVTRHATESLLLHTKIENEEPRCQEEESDSAAPAIIPRESNCKVSHVGFEMEGVKY